MSTLGQAKAVDARIAEALNIAPTDPRFVAYLNQATRRILHRGKFWGSCRRFAIAIDSQLLTLPPQVDTPEQIAVANQVLPLRSLWFELLPGGWGPRDETLTLGSGINECLYRGNYPTIKDIATPGIVTVKCDVATDAGKTVRILGYDANGNWVRRQSGGVWSDGELINLAQGAGTASVTQFSQITSVQPPDMDGQWWLYLGSVATGTLLGHYQYWESNPSYKRFLVPFINATVSTVVLTGKLAYRPVSQDSDELICGNLDALKLAMMAVKAEEGHQWGEAQLLWEGGAAKDASGATVKRIGAWQLLDQEIGHHVGDGQEIGLTLRNCGYEEPVANLV